MTTEKDLSDCYRAALLRYHCESQGLTLEIGGKLPFSSHSSNICYIQRMDVFEGENQLFICGD